MPNLTEIVLATPRLRMRWMREDDTAAQLALYADPEVVRYGGTAPWTRIEQSRERTARMLASQQEGSGACFVIELADQPGMIGHVTFYSYSEQNRRCVIGYALARAHWGHGYATEALRAVLEHGFNALGLNRVEADVDPRNHASTRLLERMGFRKEGYMPERWLVNGEVADTVNYGLLRRYRDELPPFIRP